MTAFEIHLNGHKVCTAGIGEPGVLGAHVSWARREGNQLAEELILHVGGLINSTREHVRWEEARKQYVIQMAAELGWQILTPESGSGLTPPA